MGTNNYTKYDKNFKKSLVSLHQNRKTQTQLCKEYGVSQSALGKWIKQYSTALVDDGQVLTAKTGGVRFWSCLQSRRNRLFMVK
ncbi:transposase [Oscillospiraceae bacterium DSM 107454]|uniref:Transposase n=1 Tax=Ructibacterium gallinarum TaxID=2779355 RepID=A0A9D5RA11_9FIRM|nr:transposase [Ructibacterium gallinarum]MBE5041051.1 transposase [Ructibacterium gallinarum]